MDRGIRQYSENRNDFPCKSSLEGTEDVSSTDGARTVVEQRRASPQNYQRYSYLFTEEATMTGTHSDAMQIRNEVDLDDDNGEWSSTEGASEGDSLKKVFDPSERHAPPPPPVLTNTSPTPPVNAELLLTDIVRCQSQVEELIDLFKSANLPTRMATTKPATAAKTRDGEESPFLETTPRLRQRFASRIPRCSAEAPPMDHRNLEDARQQLTQSLEDALALLERFPRERQLLQRSLTPSSAVPLTHNELLEAVDCLEQISLHASSDGDANEEQTREQDLLAYGKRRSTSRFRDVDRLPVLEETLSLSSDPCTTPSRYTGNEFWVHDATNAMISCPLSLSRASPFDEHCHHDHHDASTASDLWELFQTPSRNRDSSQPFRIFTQDPIQLGDLSRNSSQSLSGLETACAIRVRTRLERDAASDSEVLLTNEDIDPSPRRCHSATAALCPTSSSSSSSAQTNIHQRYTSLAESSDWDVVEGGISVRGLSLCLYLPACTRPTTCMAVAEDYQGHDAVPGRLTPETLPWTSTAFSTIEFRPNSRTVDVFSPSLCRKSRMTHVSETSTTHMSRELQPRVDRSVQCDFSVTSSEGITPWSGGCGFWFKKKNKKHRSNALRRILLSSSGMPQLGSDLSLYRRYGVLRDHCASSRNDGGSLAMETGILCGIRTAVRAALRPPCPHTKRDRDKRSGCVSTYLYSDSALSGTTRASRSGPSAA